MLLFTFSQHFVLETARDYSQQLKMDQMAEKETVSALLNQ